MKQSNWKASGRPQLKSAKTPKYRKRKVKQFKQLSAKLREGSKDESSFVVYMLRTPVSNQILGCRTSEADVKWSVQDLKKVGQK